MPKTQTRILIRREVKEDDIALLTEKTKKLEKANARLKREHKALREELDGASTEVDRLCEDLVSAEATIRVTQKENRLMKKELGYAVPKGRQYDSPYGVIDDHTRDLSKWQQDSVKAPTRIYDECDERYPNDEEVAMPTPVLKKKRKMKR